MATNEQQHRGFADLLLALCRSGLRTPPPALTSSMLSNGYVVSSDREIYGLLRATKGDFGSRVVALSSPNQGKFTNWLIALWASWDFESEEPNVKIEVSYIKDPKNAFYFRFEKAARGRHRYRHAQFSRNFTSALGSPNSNWDVHPSTPAFPLACGDEAGLLVACTIAIYGAEVDPDIRSTMQRMILQDGYLREMISGP